MPQFIFSQQQVKRNKIKRERKKVTQRNVAYIIN